VSAGRRVAVLTTLVWAGESIYLLPYALRRDYRSTLIEVLELPNEAALGAFYSVFGALCLGAYLAGGWIADRVAPRLLLFGSLLLTAVGGAFLATFPTTPAELYGLFGLWAVSTILTFWSPLIKLTREWGGESAQGRAFGLLDAGRGLVAAVVASAGLHLFAQRGGGAGGLRAVIGLYSMACVVGAAGVLFVLPPAKAGEVFTRAGPGLRSVLRRPRVWLLGGVIFCAYSAYYGTFYFAGYAAEAHGQSEAASARVSVASIWLRPVVPLLAGLAADRISARTTVVGSFLVLVAAFASLALLPPETGGLGLLYLQAGAIAASVFALRGVYYALLAEGGLPPHLTGTAVGLAALIGYAPDVLTPYAWGRLLDEFPGSTGYRILFGTLAASSLLGTWLALLHRPAPGPRP